MLQQLDILRVDRAARARLSRAGFRLRTVRRDQSRRRQSNDSGNCGAHPATP
jgi:hypothetical protein